MSIDTVEAETKLMVTLWNKIPFFQRLLVVTYMFLYLYFLIVCLFSYDEFKSVDNNSDVAMMIFWLVVFTVAINILPFVLHYLSISTYGIIHIIYMASTVTLVLALWFLLTTYDRRVINPVTYKDPYSIALYLLLFTFSVLWLVGSLARISK